MSGPAPKQRENRVRRAAPARGEWEVLPADPYVGPRPDLPKLPNGVKWRPQTLATWEEWWTSPMAHKWSAGDWSGLIRLAILTNDLYRGVLQAKSFAELRQMETWYGLNPEGRKKLRWVLPDEDPDAARAPLASVTDLPRSRERTDPRRKAKT